MMKDKIKETKYAKEHLKLVMNLDFTKPTEKMKEMARKNNIDCDNPQVIAEFKKIQQQNLRDIHMMKDGQKPPSFEELQEQQKLEREAEFQKKMADYEKKKKENSEQFEVYKQQQETRIIEENAKKIEDNMFSGMRDKILIGAFGLVWLGMVVYSNYTDMFKPPKVAEPILQEK